MWNGLYFLRNIDIVKIIVYDVTEKQLQGGERVKK